MIRINEIGDDHDRALCSGYMASSITNQRAEEDRRYFREQVGRYRGEEYVERFNDFSRSLNLDVLASRALALGRSSNNAFRDDSIYDMVSVGDFQQSSRLMRNFLLSDPSINYMARNQRMQAWGIERDKFAYQDDDSKRLNPYWRALNDGWVDDEGEFEMSLFDEDLDEIGGFEITEEQRLAMHLNIKHFRSFLSIPGGADPSSPENNNM